MRCSGRRQPIGEHLPADQAAKEPMMTSNAKSKRFGMISGALTAAMIAAIVATAWAGESIEYPRTRRVDQVDVYFGVKVADPYRWLEADIRTSPEVADWVAAENKITAAYLAAIPQREAIRRRLTELWNFPSIPRP